MLVHWGVGELGQGGLIRRSETRNGDIKHDGASRDIEHREIDPSRPTTGGAIADGLLSNGKRVGEGRTRLGAGARIEKGEGAVCMMRAR